MNSRFARSLKIAMQCKSSKGTMIFSVVCLVLSPVLMMVSDSSFFVGAILSLYSWMFLTQYLAIPELAEVVAASPLKRYMATTMQDIISGVGCLISYACIAIASHVNNDITFNILFAYIAIAAFTIYFGMAYRAYVIGIVVVFATLIIFGSGTFFLDMYFGLSALPIDLSGFLIILVGWVLGVVARHALYKIPMSNIMRKSLERQCR